MAYEKQYSDAVRASVETVYGAGFLSPGGSAEVGPTVTRAASTAAASATAA